jgi:FtsZ-interacting cell division protein ZipA
VGGVVGGIAVIAAAIFGFWFLTRRRKRRGDATELQSNDTKDGSMYKDNDPNRQEAGSSPMYEVDSQPRLEMDGSAQSPLQQKHHFVAELPADNERQSLNPRSTQR